MPISKRKFMKYCLTVVYFFLFLIKKLFLSFACCNFVTANLENMGRLLAIDYGKVRTGLAVTDPSKIIVSPLTTVPTAELTPFIKEYIVKEKVEHVIVGYPVNPQGGENPIVASILKFTDNLKKLFPDLPLDFYDEQYTSKMAVSAMVSGGFKRKYRQKKENTDKMAAAFILQGWIDENPL